jgi:glutathione synthase/RimK-type ligase-like ATP-grasp enzyme
MKIGIHHKESSFSERWISYCNYNRIPWKEVDCYRNDIISQMEDCDGLMWHINQNNRHEIVFAKQLIYSLIASGKKVFPNFQTVWHFDDKVGQKYLLEGIRAPIPPTYVFYDRKEALKWVSINDFPKIFKLRGGGGSQNVRMVRTRAEAVRMVRKAFGRGFLAYYAIGNLKERWRMLRLGRTDLQDILEGIVRFVLPPPYAWVRGRERGYIYFQDYIPGNEFDIRIVIVGDKAFAIKRMVRKDDFRASGSGMILYEKEHFSESTVALAFEMAEKLQTQSAAFDFVYTGDRKYVLEVSFGFIKEVYDPCTGYWDRDLQWHEGRFDPYGWMVDNLIKSITTEIRTSE